MCAAICIDVSIVENPGRDCSRISKVDPLVSGEDRRENVNYASGGRRCNIAPIPVEAPVISTDSSFGIGYSPVRYFA